MGSDFLFARPSWTSGAGRTLDLWGVFEDFNDSPTSEIADGRALFSDWRIVGEDLLRAAQIADESTLKQESVNG